jgi:hypothetical protein
MLGPDGKELPKNEKREYVGQGTPKFEEISTESTANPLTDEMGTPVERPTVEAMVAAVKEHFADDDDTEVLHVTIQETKTVAEFPGSDFKKG